MGGADCGQRQGAAGAAKQIDRDQRYLCFPPPPLKLQADFRRRSP